MTTSAPFITEIAGGIATVTLTRPEIHNAFDDELVARLTREFQGLSLDRQKFLRRRRRQLDEARGGIRP